MFLVPLAVIVGVLIVSGRSMVALVCSADLLVLAHAACMMFDCYRVGGEVS